MREVELEGGVVDLLRLEYQSHAGSSVRLSAQEGACLTFLAERAGQIVPRETLLRRVWEYQALQSRAVDKAMHRLRKKLEVDPSRPRHLTSVHGRGYRFVPVEPPRQARFTQEFALPVAPPPADRFVGRDQELRELERLAQPGRIVAVSGVGGVGKSRLLREWAHDRATWVDLSGARDAETLAQAVWRALGRSGAPPARAERLLALPDGSPPVVLDGGDHVREPLERLISASRCPSALIIGLRRAPNQPQAASLRLEPLPLPDACTLLRDRAQSRGVPLDDDAAVAAIATRLDCLPVALELAAARTELLSSDALARRLQNSLSLLQSPLHSYEPRHATIDAIVEVSWDLASDAERSLLVQCTVFAGAFRLEAVEAVARVPDHRVFALVQNLLAAGLFRRQSDPSGTWLRYGLGFRERALREGAHPAAWGRHAAWFLDTAESAQAALEGPDDARAVRALGESAVELFALSTSSSIDVAARAAVALSSWVLRRNDQAAVRRLIGPLLDAPTLPAGLRARVAQQRAALAQRFETRNAARVAIEEAERLAVPGSRGHLQTRLLRLRSDLEGSDADRLTVAEGAVVSAGDAAEEGWNNEEGLAHQLAAAAYDLADRPHAAWRHQCSAVDAADASGSPRARASARVARGMASARAGRADEANQDAADAVQLSDATDDAHFRGHIRHLAGGVFVRTGDLRTARGWMADAWTLARECGSDRLQASVAVSMGLLALQVGDAARAAKWLARGERLEGFHSTHGHPVTQEAQALCSFAQGNLAAASDRLERLAAAPGLRPSRAAAPRALLAVLRLASGLDDGGALLDLASGPHSAGHSVRSLVALGEALRSGEGPVSVPADCPGGREPIVLALLAVLANRRADDGAPPPS